MSRSIPNLPDGFDGIGIPTFGPRSMGSGNNSVAAYLNQVLNAFASLHDDGTDVRPEYLPINGLWVQTNPQGDKILWQRYNESSDVEILRVLADGTVRVAGSIDFATADDYRNATAGVAIDPAGLASQGLRVLGKIDFLPFSGDELPACWYSCNGDHYPLKSPQGEVLNAFSQTFKADWGVTVADDNISLPNLFQSDGRGYFVRAANGTTQAVGLSGVQGDAIRNITGTVNFLVASISGVANVFNWSGANSFQGFSNNVQIPGGFTFNASRVVPTAEENRPLNIGMTPAIYLGV